MLHSTQENKKITFRLKLYSCIHVYTLDKYQMTKYTWNEKRCAISEYVLWMTDKHTGGHYCPQGSTD